MGNSALERERGVGEVECLGYGLEGDVAVDHIDAIGQARVATACLLPAEVGQTQGVGEGGIGQGQRRREFRSF